MKTMVKYCNDEALPDYQSTGVTWLDAAAFDYSTATQMFFILYSKV